MSERVVRGAALSEEELGLLDTLLAEEHVGIEATSNVIPRRPVGTRVPLSYDQELIWLLECASPGMTAYKIPLVRRLRGPLDIGALQRSFTRMIARHEALRTRFAVIDGEPSQIIDEPYDATIDLLDLREIDHVEREQCAAALLRERSLKPFNLAKEHSFRVALVRLADHEHVLLIETHHILCDGWSLGVLFRDLEAHYLAYARGVEPEVEPPVIQYGDYALWQRGTISVQLPELLDHWRAELAGSLEPLEFPTDFPRPAAPTFQGARASLQLSRHELFQAKTLARRYGATLYMLLLAVYGTVLHRYTGRTGILVGSGAAARAHRETENTVGYFTDTLVQRIDVSGDPTFEELLRRVRASCIWAYEHGGVPLEKLIAELRGAEPRLNHASLFEVVLTPQNTMPVTFALAGVQVEAYDLDFAATKFDLALLPSEREDGLRLTLLYRAELFTAETMQRFLAHVRSVLTAVVRGATQRISQLRLLEPAEEAQIAAVNATAADVGLPTTVHRAVEAQAQRRPDAIAVVCGESCLSYGELNARANRIARVLRARGLGSGTPVAVFAEHSVGTIVALLGVLKAGGFYVPLAPDAASARIAQQLAESGASVIVGDAALGARHGLDPAYLIVPEEETSRVEDERNLDIEIDTECTAYALFTSGSTGVPKAAAVSHANLMHYTCAIARRLTDMQVGAPGDGLAGLENLRFGMVSTFTADLGNTAVFPALCAGGTLDIIPREVSSSAPRFMDYVRANPLDVLKITPNHFGALLAGTGGNAAVLPLRWLIVGGEPCPWALVDDIRAAQRRAPGSRCRLLNHYGPTEATVGAATFEVTDRSREAARAAFAQSVPIGIPLTNVQLHVLDGNLQPVPIGIVGELCITGLGIGQGYIGRPELTRESFREFPGLGRGYRTGDRVRRLPTGDLEFIGRIDAQVKVRGFRVELGEIEAAIIAHPAVAQAAVVAISGGSDGDTRLIAYIVPKDRSATLVEDVQSHLTALLPDYMVPSTFLALEQLPLNTNGKLDRAMLPVPAAPRKTVKRRPRTETERALAAIWAEAFRRESDSFEVDDEFLALGGHSLLAIRILGKISRQFGVRLSLTTLFEAPTIEALARAIDESSSVASVPPSIRAVSRAAYRVELQAPHADESGAGA